MNNDYKISTENENKLKLDALNEILSYDPETGIFTWKVNRSTGTARAGTEAGTLTSNGHRQIGLNGIKYYAHRLAWLLHYGEWPTKYLDHIDNNPDNNRISNLREATHAENLWNTKMQSNNATGYKGASFHKPSGRFMAKIRIDGKRKHLGYYPTAKLAHEAYKSAANKLFGEFARAS